MLVLLTICNSVLMVLGQTLWKFALLGKKIDTLPDLLRLFLNPFIILGIMTYAFATGLWIYILSKGELSFVYPIQSTAFILALASGVLFFGESITTNKLIGILVIIIGVVILTRK